MTALSRALRSTSGRRPGPVGSPRGEGFRPGLPVTLSSGWPADDGAYLVTTDGCQAHQAALPRCGMVEDATVTEELRPMAHQANLAASLGGWSARHRISAIVGWLLLVVVAMLIGSTVGQVTMTQAEYGAGESGRAQWLLTDVGVARPAQELVLVHSATATAGTSGFQAAVRAVISGVQATGRVQDVKVAAVSPSQHDVLVQFAMKGKPDSAADRVQPVLDAVSRARAAHPDVTIEQFGEASANKWFNDTIMKDFKRAEWTAVPLALGILLVVFGALVAATLPVLLALTAFFAANGLLALISHAMHVDTSASSVMLLMGLAVGVDYCLFYLRREREERAAGRDQQTALRVAAATSGRSVLISGLTVMVAMAGMFLSGMQLFAGFAVATISVVFIAMVGSVTVLPALMSLLGDKVDFGRVPFLGRTRRPSDGSRIWNSVLGRVLARPGISAALAGGLLLALELRAHYDGLPGRTRPGPGRVQGARHRNAPGPAGHHRLPAAGPAQRRDRPADPGDRAPRREPGPDPGSAGRHRNRCHLAARADHTARHARAGHPRKSHRGAGAGRRKPRCLDRLQQPAPARHRPGLPVRHGHHVHRDAGRLQLDHDRCDHDRAQPALGGRRVRGDGRGLPARLGRGPDRHDGAGSDRILDPAVRLRRAVRPVDGLQRVRGVADQGGT